VNSAHLTAPQRHDKGLQNDPVTAGFPMEFARIALCEAPLARRLLTGQPMVKTQVIVRMDHTGWVAPCGAEFSAGGEVYLEYKRRGELLELDRDVLQAINQGTWTREWRDIHVNLPDLMTYDVAGCDRYVEQLSQFGLAHPGRRLMLECHEGTTAAAYVRAAMLAKPYSFAHLVLDDWGSRDAHPEQPNLLDGTGDDESSCPAGVKIDVGRFREAATRPSAWNAFLVELSDLMDRAHWVIIEGIEKRHDFDLVVSAIPPGRILGGQGYFIDKL
jgi:hypothetical protein